MQHFGAYQPAVVRGYVEIGGGSKGQTAQYGNSSKTVLSAGQPSASPWVSECPLSEIHFRLIVDIAHEWKWEPMSFVDY